ncbi:flagellar hook-associated protein FlgL [Pseudoalteromonas aurantia]|uniref:Flagellar hook-associated protein 3 FlgL n=1 Tax=Pseudoalteromonas aurantia 208 TaxID=1314867 RepID=A0ABR9E8R0_9GAMM|nr:flagellar hook-associated protein FlgL [Pseudoalteromonas aurantia]MBE0367380.1 flagellar hook-associated protein 3 FlgL [Pseudoalteromonas aurantia 208]
MRLSNNLMHKTNLNSILNNQQEVNKAQQQVNTQKRVLTASDDPSATARALLYTDRIQTNEQYTKSLTMLNSRLKTQESVLDNIKESVTRAHVLTIQAGSGALSSEDRAGISEEISSIKETVLDLMNAKTEDGRYIFSGYQDNTQTYSFNSTTSQYEYNGDQGQHKIKVAEGVEIKSSDNGFDTFENVPKRLDIDRTTIAPGTASVYVKEQGQFDSFHKAQYNASPTAPANANTITVNFTSPTTYDVLQGGVALKSGTYADGTANIDGMEVKPNGAASITFNLEQPKKENVLNTLNKLEAALNDSSLSQNDYEQVLADSLVGLTNAKNLVSQTQSGLGGRLNTAQRIVDANADLDINNKAAKATLVELDMAEAITELTKHETALQASQATFGRLTNLSLLEYIR